jgi:protein O-mannosyl-transferase
LGGESPTGYLVLNLALHLGGVWFASRFLARLLPPNAALAATIIFALHPIQTESVAYVFARSTLLCGLFCLAALDAWTRGRHWTAVALHALALLAKEEAVALPAVFALLHFSISRNHREWRPIAAMGATSTIIGARGLFITLTQPGTGAAAGAGISPLAYLATQSYVLLRYAGEIIAPFWLNFDPDIAPGNYGWLWILWLAAVYFAARHFAKARPGFWILAALAFLAPTSTLLPIADLSADRRLYLALAAFGAALAPWIPRRALIPLALILGLLTLERARIWRTEESLWRDTVAKSPRKLRPRLHLARALPPGDALTLLESFPDPAAEAERGRLYLALQRPTDALQAFGKVLAATPGDPAALANRGAALAALGQTDAARADFERALAADPCYPPALQNLGRPPCANAPSAPGR